MFGPVPLDYEKAFFSFLKFLFVNIVIMVSYMKIILSLCTALFGITDHMAFLRYLSPRPVQ